MKNGKLKGELLPTGKQELKADFNKPKNDFIQKNRNYAKTAANRHRQC
jgi:hypothetical protein